MEHAVSEAGYPLRFREHDAMVLADYLQHRYCVELVGMKRVGINNFLRFFLFHKHIEKTYLHQERKNVFIFVDLNDLIERELFAFWRLTLKRIADATETYVDKKEVKQTISSVFLRTLQSRDTFLTYDGVKETLALLVKAGYLPTIFFTRFDRLRNIASIEFFDNLKSIRDGADQKLSYVFTSYRELSQLFPLATENELLSRFLHTIYIKPLSHTDQKAMIDILVNKYQVTLPQNIKEMIVNISGGHAQYLHLRILVALEMLKKKETITETSFTQKLLQDERITFLSDELWDSLNHEEQAILKKILTKKNRTAEEKQATHYLWDTGFIIEKNKTDHIFNQLFTAYIEKIEQHQENNNIEFSRKENALFQLLKNNLNAVCTREKIEESVWPEYKEYGVSDWTIDQLVARLRNKLEKQKSQFEIVTIRTQGYKLVGHF